MIKRVKIQNFTVFENLETDLSSGVNLFIGANGTGKTHLLKLLYSVQSAESGNSPIPDLGKKLQNVFLPDSLKRLVRKGKGAKAGSAVVRIDSKDFGFEIASNGKKQLEYTTEWDGDTGRAVYIPVKEMLANAPGFRSLYRSRETRFEEVYYDIIDKAFLPPLKNLTPEQERLTTILQREMGGKIHSRNEQFYLRTRVGDIEFGLEAEGVRKLALLWILLRNGTIGKGATLYWDEPETNLNPSMMPSVVKVLLALEREGVQVFIATHSYVVLKEFELQRENHAVRFYSLFKNENGEIEINGSKSYHGLTPNKISDQFSRIYDLEMEKAIGRNE